MLRSGTRLTPHFASFRRGIQMLRLKIEGMCAVTHNLMGCCPRCFRNTFVPVICSFVSTAWTVCTFCTAGFIYGNNLFPADKLVLPSLGFTLLAMFCWWMAQSQSSSNWQAEVFVILQFLQGLMSVWFGLFYGVVLGLEIGFRRASGFLVVWAIAALVLMPGAVLQGCDTPRREETPAEGEGQQEVLNLPLAASEDPPPPELLMGGRVNW